jgi:hypothetical protein
MAVSETANVIRIEDFLAGSARRTDVAEPEAALAGRRELTPREISHRFRMLSHLKRVAEASAIIRMTS